MESGDDYEIAIEYIKNYIINVIGPFVFEVILQNELHDFMARTEKGHIEKKNKKKTFEKRFVKSIRDVIYLGC
jgi:hypothetical protein